jgi:mono/diheme cytochrome c family protein
MRKLAIFALVLVGGLIAVALVWTVVRPGALTGTSRVVDATTQVINRGEYLARAGDCIACHTPSRRQTVLRQPCDAHAVREPLRLQHHAGRRDRHRAMDADDFYRMMQKGLSRDGTLLYPAMPFAAYTKVTREDCDAIYAYLMSVPPVRQKNRPHELRFPSTSASSSSAGARSTSRKASTFPIRSSRRNGTAGAYLVEGLGHCSMCHTAINRLGGSSEAQAFEGGMIPNQNWYAPSLTSNQEGGLGNWSVKDIADLLQVGVSHRATVYGPMAEVTYNSLQYLTDEDATAMAVYLKSLAPRDAPPAVTSTERLTQPAVLEMGRKVYVSSA